MKNESEIVELYVKHIKTNDKWAASLSETPISGAGFNGRVNRFTCVDYARPVAEQ